jgi:para-aminobenzoate synthetase / 4-amino-4-deoxychorismate lyase
VFRAVFPCGSVTGAPEVASMQITASSRAARGSTAGPSAWWGRPGRRFRARFSAAIRTAVVDRASGAAVYGAGGGITWGSDAAAERAELLAKAEILGGAAAPSGR